MKIVVLVKHVPDTWSDRQLNLTTGVVVRDASEPVPDEINERALESALRFKDANASTEVVVLSMGSSDGVKALRKLLAMGADSVVQIEDAVLAGSDMMQTASVLAAAVKRIGADLVLAGNESTDGRGGVVPAMVAELMGVPLLPSLETLEILNDSVAGTVQIDGATLSLLSDLPAVVSVTERVAEARFPNFKGMMQAKKKPLTTWPVSYLGVDVGPEARVGHSVMVSAEKQPPKQAGPKITDDGSSAVQLVDFLATNRII